jgi:hypothetical protein
MRARTPKHPISPTTSVVSTIYRPMAKRWGANPLLMYSRAQDIMQRNRSRLRIVLVTQPQADNNHRLDKQGGLRRFFERALVNEAPIRVEQPEIKADIMSFLFGATRLWVGRTRMRH